MALIGWWPLDGSAEDYSVNRNNGTPTNITYTAGKIGLSAVFGSSSELDSNYPASTLGVVTFSGSAWIYPTSSSSVNSDIDNRIFTIRRDNASTLFSIGIHNFVLRTMLWNGTAHVFSNGSSVSVNTWNHISWTYTLGVLNVYLNGVLNITTSVSVPSSNYFGNIMIGNLQLNTTNRAFVGRINDFRLYDHIISQKEINDLAKAKVLHYTFNRDDALVMDASGYKRHGIKNGTTYTQGKLGSGAYSFNGSTDAITRTMLDALGYQSFTTNVWCYFNQTNVRDVIFGTFHGSNPESFNVEKHTENRLRFYWQGVPDIFSANNALPIGEWCMVTVVRNKENSTLKMYVNGNLIVNQSTTISDITSFNSRTLYIGRDARTTSEAMNGLIDDLSFYATALSDADILDLYKTRVKFDDAGNVYANEFVEDYEIGNNITLNQIFENNNSVVNPNFEGIDGWTVYGPLEYSILGNNMINLVQTGTQASIYQPVTFTIGDIFYITARIKWNSGQCYVYRNSLTSGGTSQGIIFNILNSNYDGQQFSSRFSVSNNDSLHFRIGRGVSTPYNIDIGQVYVINLSQLVRNGYFVSEPTQDQMDAWYRDYSRVRPNAKGQMIAHELNEVGIDTIVYEGKSYRDIFETDNAFDGTFNSNELINNYIKNGITHSGTRTSTAYMMFGDPINPEQYIENGNIIYGRFDSLISTENNGYWRYWFRRSSDNLDGIDLYFITSSPGIIANTEYRDLSQYGQYTGSSILNRFHFVGGTGVIGANVTVKNPYIINLSKKFTVVPTKEQMDAMYLKYRQLKITNQKQRITRDMIVIDGEFKEV